MNVILNSDVIYSKDLRRTDLPIQVVEFLQKCAAAHHALVIPETTKIEFEKEQAKARVNPVAEIDRAANLLRQSGIDVPVLVASEIVPEVKLPQLLDQIVGLKYSIVEATLEDYQIALRKACLREPPHPPEGKSDEMRDLVIWQTAARIANQTGGAVLVSRDEVHTHFRGDAEATAHQLSRATDFEQALEILEIETTSGAIVKSYLLSRWDQILESELPLVQGANIRWVKDINFTDDEAGLTLISSKIAIATGAGAIAVCQTVLTVQNSQLMSVSMQPESASKIELIFEQPEVTDNQFAEKLESLQDILGS